MNPAAASVDATVVSCSILLVLRRLLMKKNRNKRIDAAANPTMRNTPATAPLLRKNCDVARSEVPSPLKGVGFATTIVT